MAWSKLANIARQVMSALHPKDQPMTAEPQTPPVRPEAVKPCNTANANIWTFLDYYSRLKVAPNYAVLVKGPWGSGKTHLVKGFFASHPDLKTLYVSLFGVAKISDIENEFFTQLHPVLSHRGMKITAEVFKAVLRNAKFDVKVFSGGKVGEEGKFGDIQLPKFLSDAKGRILIFDDLERAKMPMKELLGYINAFVEHDDSKVIVIANEEDILKPNDDGKLSATSQDYKDIREKLIGRTFAIQADLHSAFSGFVEAVEDADIRQFFTIKREEIETIFTQSGTDNLRFLRQTMLDFERLAGAMEPAHRRKTEALGDIVGPYFALSFEMKAQRIEYSDVIKFGAPDWSSLLSGKAKGPQTKTGERYPEVKFDNALLGMDVIRDALFNGALNREIIRERMAQSKYFTAPKDEPSWRRLWYAMTLNDKEAQEVVATVERQFQERVFTDQGELLHVVGERLWLARIGAIEQSVEEVAKECKAYIDDLYTAKRLDPAKSMVDVVGNPTESYAGLGFMEHDTAPFREVAKHLADIELRASEDQYPEKAKALLAEMATNTDLFARRLIISNSVDNIYSNVPILLAIKPADFVAQVMALPPENRRTALIAFSQRYSFLTHTPRLIPEVNWLAEVKDLLDQEVAKLPVISKYALTGAINRYVVEPLAAAQSQVTALATTPSA